MSPVNRSSSFLFDAYLPFAYKEVIDDRDTRGLSWLVPVWTGEHRRRMQAYTMLQGYRDNAARLFTQLVTAEEWSAMQKRREYGDAALLIETARSSVIGEDHKFVVAGADQNQAAAARQDEIDQWVEDDNFATTLVETERNAVTFGDGVYTVEWDAKRKRAKVKPWEPDCYFPVLHDVEQGEYPTRVHLAWELTDLDAERKHGTKDIIVHRITYELVDVTEVGLKPYRLPYETELATKVCVMSEMEFKLGEARSPDDLKDPIWVRTTEDGQLYDRLPLMVDFIPVVHIANTVSKIDHFGRSMLAYVLQLLDDIHSTDSDLQASSDLTGNPILTTSGLMPIRNEDGTEGQLRVGPGAHIPLQENGKAGFLSGRDALEWLAKHRDDLLERLAINSRIPAAAQGRIDPSKIAAGVILLISYGQLTRLVDESRLARKDPYRILPRMVQRYHVINGVWEGEIYDVSMAWGSYLPNDLAGTIASVVQAYMAKAISLETALRMLMEAGAPIDDVEEEVKRIQERDFEGGTQLLDALGSEEETAKYLQRKVPTDSRPAQPTTAADLTGTGNNIPDTTQQNDPQNPQQ